MPSDKPDIDVTQPTPAGVYDYLLGGTDNYSGDRRAAHAILDHVPEIRSDARANRNFLIRVVRHLVSAGIEQFIDLGSGLPTAENVHEVAQAANPDARVVYVDFDPRVLPHARALLGSTEGRTAYVQEDIRNVSDVLEAPETRQLIDMSKPVGLLAAAVLHFIPDEHDPAGIVARYVERLPSGSYLAISSGSSSGTPPELLARIDQVFANAPNPLYFRPREVIAGFFGDLELVDPGLVHVKDWPVPDPDTKTTLAAYGGVARVP
ncbi:SAM-dependent methyltransferase [Thermomonospora cellulosilytica]|uniref:O-methyltransferase involved in polyketide biosynthesis n=1 Tax=Thermomonospora cellulosilytica TaxID=1411118 RepID=A0A7W3R9R8_9ACTN|nr:SAM-dependent methyltransferase [Thermomonospora cellulosilytica]MBA9005056.1 O-methyltransferase involved in polyketide biosynthesis [Thermomonospora cellulosilytica]